MPFELQAKDVISPVRLIGAILSGYFLVRNYALSRMNADRAIYVDGQKFLVEICKQLISEPLLWSVYEQHVFEGEDAGRVKSPKFQAQLLAFTHLSLNMFEIVLREAPNPKAGDEDNLSNIWINYFEDTLNRSTLIRRVLDEPESSKIWSRTSCRSTANGRKNSQWPTRLSDRRVTHSPVVRKNLIRSKRAHLINALVTCDRERSWPFQWFSSSLCGTVVSMR